MLRLEERCKQQDKDLFFFFTLRAKNNQSNHTNLLYIYFELHFRLNNTRGTCFCHQQVLTAPLPSSLLVHRAGGSRRPRLLPPADGRKERPAETETAAENSAADTGGASLGRPLNRRQDVF